MSLVYIFKTVFAPVTLFKISFFNVSKESPSIFKYFALNSSFKQAKGSPLLQFQKSLRFLSLRYSAAFGRFRLVLDIQLQFPCMMLYLRIKLLAQEFFKLLFQHPWLTCHAVHTMSSIMKLVAKK